MDDDWSAGHPPNADVVVVHTPTFQVNENTVVTRHRKWRWWTSKLTDLPDQNPVSFNMVYRLFLIDRADERVDSFQKRPTKTPFHFCLISFAPRFFPHFPCGSRFPNTSPRSSRNLWFYYTCLSFGLLSSRQSTQPCVRRFVVSPFLLPSAGSTHGLCHRRRRAVRAFTSWTSWICFSSPCR